MFPPLNLPLYTRCLFRKGFFFFIPMKAKGLMSLPQLVPCYLCRRAAAAGVRARSTQLLGFVPVWGPYPGSVGALGDFPDGGRLLRCVGCFAGAAGGLQGCQCRAPRSGIAGASATIRGKVRRAVAFLVFIKLVHY